MGLIHGYVMYAMKKGGRAMADEGVVLLTAGLLEEGACTLRHQRLSDMVIAAVVD